MLTLTEAKEKSLKILVGVNVLTMIDDEIYGSHSNLWFRLGRNYPNITFFKYHPRRTSIDNMRNFAAEIALRQECDYILFIDDDVSIDPDILGHLLKAEKDVIMELTYIRGYPFNVMAFKEVVKEERGTILDFYNDYEKDMDENGLVKCDAVGCSCVLIDCNILKKMSMPYFVTGTRAHTEDIYFCIKARIEAGAEIWMDANKPTGHLLDKEFLTKSNVSQLRAYYESIGFKKEEESGDRQLDYLKHCLDQFEIPSVDKKLDLELPESVEKLLA